MTIIRLLALCLLAPLLVAQTPIPGAVLTSDGNFGIGLQEPATRLHVMGDATVTGVMKGSGYLGSWGQSAVLQGYCYSGRTPALFTLLYDDINFPGSPQGLIIANLQTSPPIFKTFIIDHPDDAARYLVHATLEGPEGAVYYRGSARLVNGRAEVVLPAYFESLTRREGRTVLLTNVDGFDTLAVRRTAGERVRDGRFIVESDNPASAQEFDWEVKAVRADGPPLEIEPKRTSVGVGGFGPYTYRLP